MPNPLRGRRRLALELLYRGRVVEAAAPPRQLSRRGSPQPLFLDCREEDDDDYADCNPQGLGPATSLPCITDGGGRPPESPP